jgi:hypothetical protein
MLAAATRGTTNNKHFFKKSIFGFFKKQFIHSQTFLPLQMVQISASQAKTTVNKL